MTAKKKPTQGGKREGAGRKNGPETEAVAFRVSKKHAEKLKALVPTKDRREWMEKTIDAL